MRQRSDNQQLLPSRTAVTPRKAPFGTTTWIILIVFSSLSSFYVGVWATLTVASGKDCADCTSICMNAVDTGDGELGRKVGRAFSKNIERVREAKCNSDLGNFASKDQTSNRFPYSVSHFASGLARVGHQDLFEEHDFGVPLSDKADRQDVLILYDSKKSLPSDKYVEIQLNGEIPRLSAADATANCDVMNTMFVKNPSNEVRQCLAIVGGQYQGHHIQRWQRLNKVEEPDRNAPLQLVGRWRRGDGYDEFLYPKQRAVDMHQELLLAYLTNLKDIKRTLNGILKKIAINNTVLVVTANMGQSELLMNFICSSQARGFDIKNILVFPTDLKTKKLADGMGLATFYDEQLMKLIPQVESARYGDHTFALLMIAKVICVQLVNELGYDLLFQDVDIVWHKDPFEFFHESNSIGNFDAYFQDDGSRQERYAPFSANSGFYFIRSNPRTKVLFRTMLYSGDLIIACRSHQQILIALLEEYNSLSGLTVKVLSREDDDFPGGYHYNMRKDFMRKMIDGKITPYIFHMSWTLNKVNKVEYLHQMGMWYLNDKCVGQEVAGILLGDDASNDVRGACCSAEPIIKCHYSDKPSIIPCKDSPPIDKNGKSFW